MIIIHSRPLLRTLARNSTQASLLAITRRTLTTTSNLNLHATLDPHAAPLIGADGKVLVGSKRSFQPHPTDAIPRPLPPAPTAKLSDLSEPHNDWVLFHPVYSAEEVNCVKVVRQTRVTTTDKVASALVKFARWGFDFVTRYKHSSPEAALEALRKAGKAELSLTELREQGYIMTEAQWMARILFLESIAGVPGFVAAMLRHLTSLRLMKRDGGWIASLLQEAENERMHLMTFLKIKQPSPFFRAIVIVTQGVFCNMFFLAYMISPKATHRFVAYLEEEACLTYTQIIDEINRGHIPEWSEGGRVKVPQIAKDYWRLPENAKMLDLLLAVRADEAGHRFLNHTLANLENDQDFNPFGLKHADAKLTGTVPGFTREQSLEWTKKVQTDFERVRKTERHEEVRRVTE